LQVNGDGLSAIDTKVGAMEFAQASVTVGVVGGRARPRQLTVDPPFAGTANVGTLIVYV
jgi:hypothetical protein